MASPSSLNRLHYTAFLYAEYVLRNIEKNKPELLTILNKLKDPIKELVTDFSADIILDSILELECYHESRMYGCDLFAGACLRKYTLRPEYQNEQFRTAVEVCHAALQESDQYPDFQEIVKTSLFEGVYITHLDSFRNKKYPLTLSNDFDTSYFWQHIFFKSDHAFWGDDKHIEYHAPDYSVLSEEDIEKQWEMAPASSKRFIPKDEYLRENTHQNSLTIFIPPYGGDDLCLEQILDQIQITAIAFRLDNLDEVFNNYEKYKLFITHFFKKGLYRESVNEFKNKNLGLLLWDEYRSAASLPRTIEKFYEKYKQRPKSNCDIPLEECCTQKCASDMGCDKAIQKVFDATCLSIEDKKITSSKQK